MANMSDGLNMQPRIGEPETSGVTGASEMVAGGLLAALASMPDTSNSGAPTPLQQPQTWTYDFDPANGIARATYGGEVVFTGGGGSGDVASFNGRTGVVTLLAADITGAGGAPITSPVLLGSPSAPTPSPGDSDTSIATTAFVQQAIAANPAVVTFNGRGGAVVLTLGDVTGAGGAPVASPALTGTPTTTTGSQGAGGSQVASQAYVEAAIAAETVISFNGRHGAVSLTLSDVESAGGAPINAPNFTGVASGATAAPGANTTQLATTAFVTAAVTAGTAGVSSFNTRTGAVVMTSADVSAAGGALLSSPALVGTPTAPTAGGGTSTTQLATTAFVANAIAGAAGVASFNGRSGIVVLNTADVTTAGGAPQASPTFTGSVHAPTPTALDNSTLVATTAFVDTAIAGLAPLSSPALIGNPTAPTPSPGDSDTSIATTAFVANAVAAGGIKSIHQQVFTASGTYTPTTGMVACLVQMVGGGGGGAGVPAPGGTNACAAGGGGAGAYSKVLLTAAQIGASQTVTIGAGGTGTSGVNVGNAGSPTSLGVLCTAPGGGGGNSQGAGGTFNVALGGVSAPAGSGSGGSGAASIVAANAGSGGNGGSGLVLITEYCSV